jgi:hypothetical protein
MRLQRRDEALQARAEAVAWQARLAHLRPDDADARTAHQQARDDLALHFSEHGLDVNAAHAAEAAAARLLPVDPPGATEDND